MTFPFSLPHFASSTHSSARFFGVVSNSHVEIDLANIEEAEIMYLVNNEVASINDDLHHDIPIAITTLCYEHTQLSPFFWCGF